MPNSNFIPYRKHFSHVSLDKMIGSTYTHSYTHFEKTAAGRNRRAESEKKDTQGQLIVTFEKTTSIESSR